MADETQIVEYDITAAAIEEMKKQYGGMKITDAISEKAVREARTLVVSKRTAIEKKRKELKASALQWGRKIDDEAKRITALLLSLEEELKAEIEIVDNERKAKKAEKDRIEQERIDGIQIKIEAIKEKGLTTINLSSDDVTALCDEILAIQITEEVYQEFAEQAKAAKLATLSALDDIYNDKVIQEKEAAERKAEIAKIEKLRAEQAEAEVKMHEELRKIELEKQAVQKIIDDEREKRDRAEFERKAQEQAKEQANRQVELEKQLKEKERIETEKEAKRQQEILPDKEKFIIFADMIYGLKIPVLENEEARDKFTELIKRLYEIARIIKDTAVTL